MPGSLKKDITIDRSISLQELSTFRNFVLLGANSLPDASAQRNGSCLRTVGEVRLLDDLIICSHDRRRASWTRRTQ